MSCATIVSTLFNALLWLASKKPVGNCLGKRETWDNVWFPIVKATLYSRTVERKWKTTMAAVLWFRKVIVQLRNSYHGGLVSSTLLLFLQHLFSQCGCYNHHPSCWFLQQWCYNRDQGAAHWVVLPLQLIGLLLLAMQYVIWPSCISLAAFSVRDNR